eukprot:CAMPEP_0206185910 /NCGR_PEP_ID=MMETSP0166-20121206/2096_1 /ASSEMBLY_ACC=CAM_ASM_000260 /TAXON_ID=95228 /ORGANISM="Vannella robusta, Strain DIVA3 518/3/11/1/6" /LENGTH=83 /DNA_ID=CAMNT_0053601209 /DNA_START=257 /DNA_END=508 /DNA_ORIENTATION=-
MKYGTDYAEIILPVIGNETLKAIVARYDAQELITRKEQFTSDIQQALSQRAADFDILVHDVAVTHLEFSEEFVKAMEQQYQHE